MPTVYLCPNNALGPIGAVNLVWITQAASEAQFVATHLAALVEAAREIACRYESQAPFDA